MLEVRGVLEVRGCWRLGCVGGQGLLTDQYLINCKNRQNRLSRLNAVNVSHSTQY